MIRRLAAVVAIALAFVACGGDEPEPELVKVDPALAPDAAVDGRVKLFENVEDGTRAAFADAGEASLLADGRLWEIRRAERLVGTLQISTVVPRVDLGDERRRQAIVRDILVGSPENILVEDVEVATVTVQDRAVYVWFGVDLVQILTARGFDEIEPEQILTSILVHQKTQSAWEPLGVDVGERD